MSEEPFKPKGELPEWRMVYDQLLASAEFGDVITYQQLDEVLGRRFVDNRAPIYRARTELGDMRHRWLTSVPDVGYRVIDANEHITEAQRHKRRARRQLGFMVKVAEVTDLGRLTQDELVRFDAQARINNTLYLVAVHHEQRLNRIEAIMRDEGKL